MSRRIVVEEPCRHGLLRKHHPLEPIHDATIDRCPGGSRTVLEGIPDEWVDSVVADLNASLVVVTSGRFGVAPDWVRKALVAAVFGETHEPQ